MVQQNSDPSTTPSLQETALSRAFDNILGSGGPIRPLIVEPTYRINFKHGLREDYIYKHDKPIFKKYALTYGAGPASTLAVFDYPVSRKMFLFIYKLGIFYSNGLDEAHTTLSFQKNNAELFQDTTTYQGRPFFDDRMQDCEIWCDENSHVTMRVTTDGLQTGGTLQVAFFGVQLT